MKMKNLILIPMTLAMVSCLPTQTSSNKKTTDRPASTARNANETDIQFAAKLTRVGEILINNPVGVTHSHDLFNRALRLDPSNEKALFYSAFTGILMSMDGLANRSKSLAEDPTTYDTLVNEARNKMKYPEFVDFLTGRSNQSEIKTYQEFKRFMQIEVVQAFEEAGDKISRIKNDLNLILTNAGEKTETYYECTYESDGSSYCYEDEYSNGTSVNPATTATVDANDIKIIANGLKAYAAAFKLYTGYSVEGIEEVQSEIKAKKEELGRSLTEKEEHAIARKYRSYLTLESDHKWNEVTSNLIDITEAAMDLDTLNNQFCENDLRVNNLIKSICVTAEDRATLKETLDLLSGPQEISLGLDEQGNSVNILVDLPSYMNNPVSDLKSLMPSEYNEDGTPNYTQEPNLNGLFPNNDLLEKLGRVVSENQES